jgi:hypothetical protein
MMEYKGKRKLVPSDKVESFKAGGATVVEAAPKPADHPAGPAEHGAEEVNEPAGPEEPEGFLARKSKELGAAITEGKQTEADLLRGGSQGFTAGFADELGGLAAGAGSLFGSARDALTGFNGGDEGALDAAKRAYTEGRDSERAKVKAARDRSPVASTVGEIAGGVLVPGGAASKMSSIPKKMLAGAATGSALGALSGIGSAESMDVAPESMVVPTIVGGLAGGLIPGGAAVAMPLLRKAGAAGGTLLRKVGSEGFREGAADVADKFAKEGAEGLRKNVAGRVGGLLRKKQKGPASLQEQMDAMPFDGEDIPVQASDIVDEAPVARAADELPPDIAPPEPGDAVMSPPLAVEPQETMLRPRTNLRMDFEAPASPGEPAASVLRPKPLEPEVITTPGPVAKSPSPGASQPGGIYQPPLQGMDAKIQEAAVRLGTTDLATIANDLKIPTTRIEGNLENLMRQFRFRDAVAKASPTPSQVLAEKAVPDVDPGYGSVLRRAKETAQSPIDNVSGRNIKQVAAVKQQETWRATYDRLPQNQRLLFMRQIKQETGLPDDTIRRRLKLTKKEWDRYSMERGGAL